MANQQPSNEHGEGLMVAVFLMGEASFALDTATVNEVVLPREITPVHHAPPHVAGIRNLRGRIVTVIDLAVRLNLGQARSGFDSRILILEWCGEQIGFLVDAVFDVITLAPASLAPPPANLHGLQPPLLRGVFTHEQRLVALLDADPLLAVDDPSSSALQSERVTA